GIGEARRLLRVRLACDALADAGFDYAAADIEAAFLAAGVEHELLHASERDFTAHGRTVAYLRQIDDEIGDRLDERAWARLDEAILTPMLTHRPVVMKDAHETLDAVRAHGLSVGLISNTGITPGFVLRHILDDMGLWRLLDHAVFSDEEELAKPAVALFENTLDEMGVAATEAAFLGDQPRLDVAGALRAGMWSLQIGDVAPIDGVAPHARIGGLAELLPALRLLELLPDVSPRAVAGEC
ncbi:MAG: HAD family hydrolase, partial [Dehalococcoidia bacterium]